MVYDQRQIGFSALPIPADEVIPGCGFPCCGTEAEGGDNLTVYGSEITLLSAGQGFVSKIMIAFNVFVPKT